MFALSTTHDFDSRKTGVLYVDLPKNWNLPRLAERLYNRKREALLNCSAVVIRMSVDVPHSDAEVITKHDWDSLRARLPKQSIFALYSNNFRHQITDNLNQNGSVTLNENAKKTFISKLRQDELKHFAIDSNAILQITESSVFRLPSQVFSNKFIRVGNIQTSKPAIDAVFFWMLPWLKETGSIITETWTISSISLNASRLLSRYTGEPPCRVDMISQYHDGSTEILEQLESAIERAWEQKGKILFLISACMSGNLERIFRKSVKRLADDKRISFLALYRLCAHTEIEHLCDLSPLNFSFNELTQAQLGDRTVIEIDKRTYFPVNQVDRPVRIKQDKSTWKYGRDTLDAYRNKEFISCHRNSYDFFEQRIRHHAIYFDLSKILNTGRFSSRLKSFIIELKTPPNLIITPPHQEGAKFANYAAQLIFDIYRSKCPVYLERDLTQPKDPALLDLLKSHLNHNSVLVMDDVSTSGDRLLTYQRDFRIIEFRGRIHYLVGIARPESVVDWDERKTQLVYRHGVQARDFHTLSALETVILPDWNENQCPWCKEEDLLRRVSLEYSPLPMFVRNRLRVLQQRDGRHPLINNVFLQLNTDTRMSVTKNSLFLDAPATQADLIAGVAHKLAMMRTLNDHHGLRSSGFPDRSIVNMNCYLGHWHNDSAIRAAILRLTTRPEVEYSSAKDELQRKQKVLKAILDVDPNTSNLAPELLLGIAVRHLPQICLSNTDENLLHSRGLQEIAQTLLSATTFSF